MAGYSSTWSIAFASSGRVTEIFVLRDGHWTNPGWHTDTEKKRLLHYLVTFSPEIRCW